MAKSIQYKAAGGIVVNGDQILLLDRPTRGEVRLPKGHIEAGESAVEAALRETAEETGYYDLAIVADLGKQVVEFDHQGQHVVRQERYFLMRLLSERQIPRSQSDADQFHVRWFPLAAAADQLTYAAEQEMVRRALQKLAHS